jgi:hypothetical protein
VWPQWLTDPLSGKTSLSRAFWLYGLGGSIVYSVMGFLFPETPAGFTVYTLLGLAVGTLQSVILWRCAPNSSSAFMGRFVRLAVIVGLIMVPVMLYLLITNPDVLRPPGNRWTGP